MRHEWVAAVPTTWNAVPNGHDALAHDGEGMIEPARSVFPTVVYRRYTRGWRRPLRNAPRASVDHDKVPGPLLRAREGDRLLVHFKNLDTLFKRSHSMHFHGVGYRPGSDGVYLPGFPEKGGDVKPGQTFTYRLRAGPTRPASGRTTTTRARCTSRCSAACTGPSRSSGALSGRPTVSS